jgi:hypothetical protein
VPSIRKSATIVELMDGFMHKCLVCALVSISAAVASQPAGAQTKQVATTESFTCELTKANGRYPPSQAWGRGADFYGNESIAIGVGPEGRTVVFEPGGPGFVLPDGSLAMKFLWAKARQSMTIEGRRLDAPAPPLQSHVSDDHADADFQPSSLIFPTPGCWEITSRVGESSLRFVIKVVKIGNGPDPLSAWLRMEERMRAPAAVNLPQRLGLPTAPW